MKSNVRRSKFYTPWQRNDRDKTTLNTVDVAEHALKRRLLNLCFTDKSVRAASYFVVKHVDRWNHLLVEGCNGTDWSESADFSAKVDALVFDIMGDLCFGKSFDDDRMDATYLVLMTDCIPSMSDTLLRNGGLYDARGNLARIEQWAREHPGVPAGADQLAQGSHADVHLQHHGHAGHRVQAEASRAGAAVDFYQVGKPHAGEREAGPRHHDMRSKYGGTVHSTPGNSRHGCKEKIQGW
ncbi:hypothetical protein Hte_009251 [Hypoxylon texense]